MINKVTLNGVEIPGIVYGSFHYHAQAGYPGEMRFGGVFGSYIEFDYFVPSAATLTKGDVLKYYQSVDTTSAFAPSTTTDIFVDNYIVKEVVEKNGKNHILAYNEVDLLNVDFSAHLVSLENSFPLAIYQLIQEIETVSGLSYEWAYPLPSWMYYKISYFYVDGITCRDILNYIAEFGGGLFWVKNSHIGINIIGNAYSSFYLSPERYVVTPDNADYSVLYNGNVLFGINAWYKENSFSQQEQPAIYDGLRIVSSNGAILGSYDSVSPPQKIYYVTRNLLIDNIYSTRNDTFNDYAQYLYNQSLKLFSWQSYGTTYYYVPTKVTLFPFRFPYVINSHVFIVDKGGNIVAFPIMSLDLTESGVTIEGYGQDESEKDYYTNYETSQQNQTLLTSQINSLFKSIDNIVTNMPVPSDTTPEDLGTADAGTSNEYSRADHVHDMPSASDVGAFPGITNVTSGAADLDDYMTQGLYYFSTGATLSNTPNSATNGWLIVLVTDNGARAKQIWHRQGTATTHMDFYTRYYNSANWSDWTRVDTTTWITSGKANLNDYTTPGTYYFSASVTLSNVPNGADHGWLIVFANQTGSAVRQIWHRAGSSATAYKDIFVREYSSSTWRSWTQVSGYLTPSTSPGTVSGYTFSNFACRKKNGWVYVQVDVSTTATPGNGGVTVCTLPAGYRPDFAVRGRSPGASGGHYYNYSITTEGVFQVSRNPASVAANTRINVQFPVPN